MKLDITHPDYWKLVNLFARVCNMRRMTTDGEVLRAFNEGWRDQWQWCVDAGFPVQEKQ